VSVVEVDFVRFRKEVLQRTIVFHFYIVFTRKIYKIQNIQLFFIFQSPKLKKIKKLNIN
jgi:2C-methyl-D-erythritol 2,4-cyclodiphosphate synthase